MLTMRIFISDISNEYLGQSADLTDPKSEKKFPVDRFVRYSPILILFSHPPRKRTQVSGGAKSTGERT